MRKKETLGILLIFGTFLKCSFSQNLADFDFFNNDSQNRRVPQTKQHSTTTPVPILQQINEHNEDGSYSYGYEAADGSFKLETRFPDGRVKGKYGYVDIHTGKLKVIEYGADDLGFQPVGDLPEGIVVPPPVPGNDTSDFSNIYQLKGLKPKNKGHTDFYECCDLTKKVYLADYDYDEGVPPNEVVTSSLPSPPIDIDSQRFVVENRARGIGATIPTRSNNFDSFEPTQNRGQSLQRPVTPPPRPRIPELRPKVSSQPQNGRSNAASNSFQNFPSEVQRTQRPTSAFSRQRPEVPSPETVHKMDAFSAFQTPFDFDREHIEEIERRRPGQTTPPPALRFQPVNSAVLPSQTGSRNPDPQTGSRIPGLFRIPANNNPLKKEPKSIPLSTGALDPRTQIPQQKPVESSRPTIPNAADPRRPFISRTLVNNEKTRQNKVQDQSFIGLPEAAEVQTGSRRPFFRETNVLRNSRPPLSQSGFNPEGSIRQVPTATPILPEEPRRLSGRQRRPIRIKVSDQIRSQPDQLRSQQQQQTLQEFPLVQKTVSSSPDTEITTRRPTRPIGFDPRRVRPFSPSSLPSRTRPSNDETTTTESKQTVEKVNNVRVRSRTRARKRPVNQADRNINSSIEDQRSAIAAERPTKVPAKIQTSSNEGLVFSSFPAKPASTPKSAESSSPPENNRPVFPSFIPKQIPEISQQPAAIFEPTRRPTSSTNLGQKINKVEKSKSSSSSLDSFPSFSALPEVKTKAVPVTQSPSARVTALLENRRKQKNNGQSAGEESNSKNFQTETKKSNKPLLPTRPSPILRDSFAPTPLVSRAPVTESSRSVSSQSPTILNFTNFPAKNSNNEKTRQNKVQDQQQQQPPRRINNRPETDVATGDGGAAPVRSSRPIQSLIPQQQVQNPQKSPKSLPPPTTPAVSSGLKPKTAPGSPQFFDELIREFTGLRPMQISNVQTRSPSLFNAIPVEHSPRTVSLPRPTRRFRPHHTAMPVNHAPFYLLT